MYRWWRDRFVPRSLRGSSNGRSSPGSLVSASARDAGNRCVAGCPDELPYGASVTTSEVAGNRAGGRRTAVLTLDRAIPDRPSSIYSAHASLAGARRLRVRGQKWPTAGRPCGLRPRAPTLHPCGGESKSLGLAKAKPLAFARGGRDVGHQQNGLTPGFFEVAGFRLKARSR